MTERSENEIAVMVTKAARGAGLPLGHAEILGGAAVWLGSDLSPLVRSLVNFGNPAFTSARGVFEGVVLANQAYLGHGEPRSVLGMDEPSVACACAQNYAYLLGMQARCETNATAVTIVIEEGARANRPAGRFDIEDEVWDQLADMAARILVPATEASRLSGAGAGLTDND